MERWLRINTMMPVLALSGAIGLGFGADQPAQAECLIFCSDGAVAPDVAVKTLAADLGHALPKGVDVVGMLEGGFQDRFMQARLRATPEAAEAFLSRLGLTYADLTESYSPGAAPEVPDWWDVAKADAPKGAEIASPTLPYLSFWMAADPAAPGMVAIWLFGFET